MVKKGGLGRGLDSLIPKKRTEEKQLQSVSSSVTSRSAVRVEENERVLRVDVNKVLPNPHQPRRVFSHQELEDLIQSVKEYGIIQPIVVTEKDDHYELIAGERRLRAATIAGLKKIPVIVRGAKEQEKLELALIENIQRADLNPLEEARGYERLMESFGLTQEAVAKKMGKSRSLIANTLRLLKLPEKVRRAIEDKKISSGHARALATLPTEKEQLEFLERILSERMSVRAVETASRSVNVRSYKRRVDPNLKAKEEKLESVLGTKVRIRKKLKGGEVIIEFYSDGDLDQIIKKVV